ncbi:hypothetical protein DOY81_000472 [Sarcophaga bullata]|nr:hypothetical protein DOY81_000472 [Sarcophaga bullata]
MKIIIHFRPVPADPRQKIFLYTNADKNNRNSRDLLNAQKLGIT